MDRVVENNETEVPPIPEELEKVLLFVLDEAKEKLTQEGEFVPFTTLIIKDNLFIETHPGESSDECFDLARHTVEGARGADAYGFGYDGYVEVDVGTKDAVIAEGGVPGEEEGYAIGYLYTMVDGKPVFEEEAAYIGRAPNFMASLKEALQYSDEEIDERYLDEDIAEFEDDSEGDE